ncbi:winged helix-turn-helix domain-containing protein [Aquimarina sp. ERC-38]|uniref:helix-turn-helix domain-containing protein n=1 Tax=Aquimarina sp. ERC-38 TaxID=2949996 RepID=UPI002246EAE9|nr:winged helix-turn-helix domain-containing protein [Aquimarina sp. ERC-38]UZO79179.1 winged helix-turn-helix domain-containing protein [Aquimarina sp. ERC-38]UZO81769.1 winged helix-turn-helix domain-containing protein [Aquimarina sp. ERC-38]UZO81772.1 winged helix-turn-helix domain-containing protein [Aquimarina sp. ERC-38]
MGKHISFEVLETSSQLRSMIGKASHSKNVLRLQSLLYIKEKTFKKQSDLAKHLGYNVRTMELWLKTYKEEGIEAMLIGSKPRKAKERKVTKAVHTGLSKRLNDSYQGFESYVQAVNWVKEQYGISYPYNTLREYMIDVFGSKIKQPRKSHIKKDPEAQADFLKLTKSNF